jgi:N-acetylglutamate synthase-like GNAT family acetyltransferase
MKNNQQIRIEKNTILWNDLINVYEEIGWGNRSDYTTIPENLHSEHCHYYSLYIDTELVGISKVLTDHYSFSLLLELAIRPHFQQSGFGTILLDFIEKNIPTTHLFVHSLLTTEDFFTSKHYSQATKYHLLLKKVP